MQQQRIGHLHHYRLLQQLGPDALNQTSRSPFPEGVFDEIGAPFPPAYGTKPRLWKFTAVPDRRLHSGPVDMSSSPTSIGIVDDNVYQLTVGGPL
jgi:hypothetical protein